MSQQQFQKEVMDELRMQEEGNKVSVYTKLSDAREAFHKLELKKTGHNKFANYFYFELGDFLIPALEVFKQFGLIGIVSFGKEMASMTIVDIETGEKHIIESPMSTAALKGCHEVQNLGAVETYIRRYLWVAALEIIEHDALDATTGKKGDAPTIPARPKTDELDLDAETIKFIEELAVDLKGMCEDGNAKEAVLKYKAAGMEGDMHIAFQNMIDSKTRTALRKAQEELKKGE